MAGDHLRLLILVLALDAAIGYPEVLFRRIGHPVTWMGAAVELCERHLNPSARSFAARRVGGAIALLLILVAACGIALSIGWLDFLPLTVICGAALMAQRSLYVHVLAVAEALEDGGLEAGRRAVARIVGRDTDALDAHAVCRAAIESLSESASDGVAAPAFWLAFAGLPGCVFYKAVNTADSMIGHRTEKYEAFGWASARLDDLVNLVPARLTALLIAAAALFIRDADATAALRSAWRDGRKHKSPNAGWPEAAMAGALGLKLAGPRIYDGELVDSVYMGDGRYRARVEDIYRALSLARIAALLQFLLILVLALLTTL